MGESLIGEQKSKMEKGDARRSNVKSERSANAKGQAHSLGHKMYPPIG